MVAIAGFSRCGLLTRDFLLHITRPDAPRKPWRHQEEALMRAIYAYELLQERELLLKLSLVAGKPLSLGQSLLG